MIEKIENLEESYVRLQQVQTLLNLLADGYFDQDEVNMRNERDILKLTWEYKKYQDVLFVSMKILNEETKEIENNVKKIYEELKRS